MNAPNRCAIVIFGASGDLTKRKLVPALFELHCQGHLAEGFAVLGVGRTAFTDEEFRDTQRSALATFAKGIHATAAQVDAFVVQQNNAGVRPPDQHKGKQRHPIDPQKRYVDNYHSEK